MVGLWLFCGLHLPEYGRREYGLAGSRSARHPTCLANRFLETVVDEESRTQRRHIVELALPVAWPGKFSVLLRSVFVSLRL
jgi:hypothetical protein